MTSTTNTVSDCRSRFKELQVSEDKKDALIEVRVSATDDGLVTHHISAGSTSNLGLSYRPSS